MSSYPKCMSTVQCIHTVQGIPPSIYCVVNRRRTS